MTTCKPRGSSSQVPRSTATQHSPSALTDVCQTSPSLLNAPHHVQMPSYQTTPHDSTHQPARPHPYGWSHSDHSAISTASTVRGGALSSLRGQPRALSDSAVRSGPSQTAVLRTVFVQDVGWASQVSDSHRHVYQCSHQEFSTQSCICVRWCQERSVSTTLTALNCCWTRQQAPALSSSLTPTDRR